MSGLMDLHTNLLSSLLLLLRSGIGEGFVIPFNF